MTTVCLDALKSIGVVPLSWSCRWGFVGLSGRQRSSSRIPKERSRLDLNRVRNRELDAAVYGNSQLGVAKPRLSYAVSEKENIAYPDNLRWKCVRCATCCGDTNKRLRHVLILASEAQAIAAETGMRIEEFAHRLGNSRPYEFELRKKNSRCMFLNGVSCSIYSKRPLICRFYPFVLEQSKRGMLEFELPEHECQGVGRGRKLTQDYYVRLLQIALRKLTPRSPR